MSLVTTDRSDLIKRVMSFPMDKVVLRYATEQAIDVQVAWRHEKELKRYLILCSINPRETYGVAGPIDELWHTFILHTRLYARFCDEVAGIFIHHTPRTSVVNCGLLMSGEHTETVDEPLLATAVSPSLLSQINEVRVSRLSYKRTLSAYATIFQEAPPLDIWPECNTAADCDDDDEEDPIDDEG